MTKRDFIASCLLTCLIVAWISLPAAAESFADRLEAPLDRAIDTRIRTQEDLDQWQRERTQLIARYESLQAEQAALADRLSLLEKSVSDQQALNRSLETRISDAEKMAAAIEPFLEEVYSRLELQVKGDLPFLSPERKERLCGRGVNGSGKGA